MSLSTSAIINTNKIKFLQHHPHSIKEESTNIESSTRFTRSAYHRSLLYEDYCASFDTCSDSEWQNLQSERDYGGCIKDLCLSGNAVKCLGQDMAENMCRDVRCLKHASWGQCGCQWYMNNYDVSEIQVLTHIMDIYGLGHGICVLNQYMGFVYGGDDSIVTIGDGSEMTTYTYDNCINPDTCFKYCACSRKAYNNIEHDYYLHGIYDPSEYHACFRDLCIAGKENECTNVNPDDGICNEIDAECLKNGSWEKCRCQKLVNSDPLSSEAKIQALCCKKKDLHGRGWNLCLYYESLGMTLADAINTIESPCQTARPAKISPPALHPLLLLY